MSNESTPAPQSAAESAPESAPSPPRPKRNWSLRRFSLRTMLIVAPLLAIGLGLGFRWWYPRYLERRATEEVERLGGTITSDPLTGKTWVELPGKGITDEELARLVPHLRNLSKLTDLVLVSNKVSDEGLMLLAEIPQLKFIYVADTQVTDEGIAKLRAIRPSLTVDRTNPNAKAMRLAARPIFEHALLRLALAPGGRHVLAGSGDGRLHVFDLAAGEMTRSLAAHDEWAFAVAFHPGGDLVATGGGDNLLKLWSWPALTEVARLAGHEDDVHAVAFTPDGSRLVSAGDDLTVRVWDVATRTQLHCLRGHDDTIPALAISPDGSLAATASRDQTIRLWSLESGQCLAVLEGHAEDVLSVAFHPGGHELASASYDKTVRLWNIFQPEAPALRRVLRASKDWLFTVAYSPGGDEIAAGGGDGVRLWEGETGRLLWRADDPPNVSHVLWLNSEELAGASANASVALFRASSGEPLATLWTKFAAN